MSSSLSAPKATKKSHQSTHHGHIINDPYNWLRDPNYPEVGDEDILKYLQDENGYFDQFMKPLQELKETIFSEIKGRLKDDDYSVPVEDRDYKYFWRFEKGAEHLQWLRTTLSGDDPIIILDEAMRAKSHNYYKSRSYDISPDENIILWSEDNDGSERYSILVRDLTTNEIFTDNVSNTSGVGIWVRDNHSFLYVELSENLRPYKVRMHTIGQPQEKDITIYEEADTSFFVNISKLRSNEQVLISCGNHVTSEIHMLAFAQPTDGLTTVALRADGHQYDLTQVGNHYYIRTNDRHKNFRIVRAELDKVTPDNWQEIIAPSDKSYLHNISGFKNFLAIEERLDGLDHISIFGLDGKKHSIVFPEETFDANLGIIAKYDSDNIRINYQSMVTPKTVYDFNVHDKKLVTLKAQEIPSGYDASQYTSERLMVAARDGVLVPVSIVYRKDFVKNGQGKVHLYGYGAYGLGMSPSFSTARISLLDRGFAYAIAHIRGGDEMGYSWYEDGKLDKRENTFHDFIDVAHYLADNGFSNAGNISTSGGSAGGSLMGYIANAEPLLWRAIVAHVPFVDILNTMLDDTLPLTPIEWPEWGNPITDKKIFEHIRSYSPYDQVTKQHYPPMLVTAGLNDPRVTYWEPAKWVAKLREYKTDDNILLLKTNMGAGHGGKSGRYDSLNEVAEEFAFIINAFSEKK
jgi:oligopeptidase B